MHGCVVRSKPQLKNYSTGIGAKFALPSWCPRRLSPLNNPSRYAPRKPGGRPTSCYTTPAGLWGHGREQEEWTFSEPKWWSWIKDLCSWCMGSMKREDLPFFQLPWGDRIIIMWKSNNKKLRGHCKNPKKISGKHFKRRFLNLIKLFGGRILFFTYMANLAYWLNSVHKTHDFPSPCGA